MGRWTMRGGGQNASGVRRVYELDSTLVTLTIFS